METFRFNGRYTIGKSYSIKMVYLVLRNTCHEVDKFVLYPSAPTVKCFDGYGL